jgi:hypothetical protein
MHVKALRAYFQDLLAGDPVALTFTGILLGIAFLLVVAWMIFLLHKKRADKKSQQKRKLRDLEADKFYRKMKERNP